MSTRQIISRRPHPIVREELERSRIPENLWASKLDTVQGSAKDKLAKFLENLDEAVREGVGLWVYGEPGVGKSAVAAIIARDVKLLCAPSHWASVWELRQAVLENQDFDSEMSISERCRSVEVLVLDGLRPQDLQDKKFFADFLTGLVCERIDRKLMTIITCERSPGAFEMEQEAFAMKTRGALLPLEIQGSDLREVVETTRAKRFFGGK